jgi:hypothetical protein
MLVQLRSHVRHNMVGYLALFIALGGTSAYAVNEWNGSNIQDGTLTGADIQDLSLGLPDYGANSISTGKLKDGDVRTQDLRDLGVTNSKINWDSVTSGKVLNNNLTADDVGANAVNTSELADGAAATELFDQSIPNGRTLRGHVAGGRADSLNTARGTISFLARGPSTPLVGGSFAIGSTGADPDCTGTYTNPTAPPGKVCVYYGFVVGGAVSYFATRDGAIINVLDSGCECLPRFYATWAYTAGTAPPQPS